MPFTLPLNLSATSPPLQFHQLALADTSSYYNLSNMSPYLLSAPFTPLPASPSPTFWTAFTGSVFTPPSFLATLSHPPLPPYPLKFQHFTVRIPSFSLPTSFNSLTSVSPNSAPSASVSLPTLSTPHSTSRYPLHSINEQQPSPPLFPSPLLPLIFSLSSSDFS